VNYVRTIRGLFPDHILIAGNVVTREMTEALILAGANIVKIGIGPGSVCTTRKVAGVGYPQLSCIMECADAAHGLGGYVLSDGGCTCPGDVAKAFGAGADFVMIGGMFAGTDESAGEETEDGKEFYGMSSATAMEKHSGGVATYRAAEGKRVLVKPVGPVAGVIQQILGGVRSACTYVGAARLKDLPKCTTFVRVNRQLNNIFT
jgi:GMP reductase